MNKNFLGNRMKAYEKQSEAFLDPSKPIIIRIDGKNLSKWKKRNKLNKPFDKGFYLAMKATALFLVENIQDAICLLAQSDEISLVLMPPEKSEGWYRGRTQEICSVASAMASTHFNTYINVDQYDKFYSLAFFGAKAFNVESIDEAVNYLIWRRNDALKNAVGSACASNFSSKALLGLNQNQRIKKLFEEKEIDFYKDYSNSIKYGTFIRKVPSLIENGEGEEYLRSEWVCDANSLEKVNFIDLKNKLLENNIAKKKFALKLPAQETQQ